MKIGKYFCCVLAVNFIITCSKPAMAFNNVDFDVKGSIFVSYDDNVTFANENKESDFVTNALVGFGVEQEGKTYRWGANVDVIQQIYADNSSFNNNTQILDVFFEKDFGRHNRLKIENKFTHSEEPRDFDDAFDRTSGRYTYYLNRFNAEYVKQLSRQLNLKTRYENEFFTASRDDIDDSYLHAFEIMSEFEKNSEFKFLGGYRFETRSFDPGGEAYIHRLTAGFKKFLTQQLAIETRAGVAIIDGFLDDTVEPDVYVALLRDLNERTALKLAYRLQSRTSQSTEDIFDTWQIELSLIQQLLSRLNLEFTLFYGEGEFENLAIDEDFFGVDIQFNYDVKENIRAFLMYEFSETNSNDDSRSYDRNLISVGVDVIF